MNEKNVTIDNSELKATLEAIRLKESSSLENKAYDLISNSAQFFSVVTRAKDFSEKNPKYEFPVLTTTGHGYLFYPIFTSIDEVKKWGDQDCSETLVLTFDSYAAMLEQNPKVQGLVIDPFSENFSLEREMVDYLKVQKAFVGKLAIEQMFQEEHSEGLKFSEPETYPTEMIDALKAHFAEDGTIHNAWLRLMKNEEETSYLIVIDADNSDTNCDFGAISSIALPYLKDLYLDLCNKDEELGQLAVEGAEPFYTKA